MGRVFFAGGKVGMDKPGSRLPSGYTELAYIESSGTQYIDTGFTPNQDTRIIADVEITSVVSNGSGIFGARQSYNSQAFSVWGVPGKLHSDYNNDYIQNDCAIIGRLTIDKNKNVTTADSVMITHTYASFEAAGTALLGAARNGGTAYQDGLVGKIYSCQVYDNGTLIRDFVPCLSDADGVGLFDLVESKFYGNVGSGSFIGSEVA